MKKEERYAGFWSRFVAFSFDMIIFFLSGYSLQIAFTYSFPGLAKIFFSDIWQIVSTGAITQRSLSNFLILCAFWFIAAWQYFAIMESSRLQGTIGKIGLGLRVKHENGKRLDYASATKRYAGKLLSFLTIGLLFLAIAFRKKKQGIHDQLAKSVVIKTKDCTYLIIACIFAMFFWLPLLNFAFLAAAIWLSIYQLRLVIKDRKTYGGMILSIICAIFATYSLIVGIRIFILYQTGQLS
jgi:uncharacterized RDD family membrane protein YckC